VVAFKVMGHEKVWYSMAACLLDKDTMLLKKDRNNYMKGDFTANFQPQLFKTKEQVLENIQTKEALFVDARSTDRFRRNGRATSWIEKWTHSPVQ
jgi:thiosulfate/3-mercaptopyruvate sulfurtransferase